MRFRCKYRQQLVLGGATDDADNRKRRADDEPTSANARMLSNVAPPRDRDAKQTATKRKRVHDSPSPPRRTGTGSVTSQSEIESRLGVPVNGRVDSPANDASAFQRVQLPPPSSSSSSTSGPRSTPTGSAAVNLDGVGASSSGLFLFPGLVAAAAPRALPAPDRLPLGFPAAIAPNELHPVNGLNNNNNNNEEHVAGPVSYTHLTLPTILRV